MCGSTWPVDSSATANQRGEGAGSSTDAYAGTFLEDCARCGNLCCAARPVPVPHQCSDFIIKYRVCARCVSAFVSECVDCGGHAPPPRRDCGICLRAVCDGCASLRCSRAHGTGLWSPPFRVCVGCAHALDSSYPSSDSSSDHFYSTSDSSGDSDGDGPEGLGGPSPAAGSSCDYIDN